MNQGVQMELKRCREKPSITEGAPHVLCVGDVAHILSRGTKTTFFIFLNNFISPAPSAAGSHKTLGVLPPGLPPQPHSQPREESPSPLTKEESGWKVRMTLLRSLAKGKGRVDLDFWTPSPVPTWRRHSALASGITIHGA